MGRVTAGLVAAGLLGAVFGCGEEARTQTHPHPRPGSISGVLTRCQVSRNVVTITLREEDGQRKTLTVSDAAVERSMPAAYRELVGPAYQRDGACAEPGERMWVSYCLDCSVSTVNAIVFGGRGDTFDDGQSRLWLVRRFVDTTHPDGLVDEFMVSAVLAKHNRTHGTLRSFWMRGPFDRALWTYSTPEHAEVIFGRFGLNRPEIHQTIASGVDAFARFYDRVGAVEAIPYMPVGNPMTSPFVGWWGIFARRLVVEEADGSLTAVY